MMRRELSKYCALAIILYIFFFASFSFVSWLTLVYDIPVCMLIMFVAIPGLAVLCYINYKDVGRMCVNIIKRRRNVDVRG